MSFEYRISFELFFVENIFWNYFSLKSIFFEKLWFKTLICGDRDLIDIVMSVGLITVGGGGAGLATWFERLDRRQWSLPYLELFVCIGLFSFPLFGVLCFSTRSFSTCSFEKRWSVDFFLVHKYVCTRGVCTYRRSWVSHNSSSSSSLLTSVAVGLQ